MEEILEDYISSEDLRTDATLTNARKNLDSISQAEKDRLQQKRMILLLQQKFESVYHNHLQNGTVTTREQFDYAWCCIRSKYPTDIRRGVVLLEDLIHNGDPSSKRDYIYYLAVGYTKLKDYTRALNLLSKFLGIEPTNRQAQALQTYVKAKMRKEGLLGMALVGGAALAIGSVVGIGMALAKK